MQVGCALNRVISFTRHACNRIWLEVALVSGIIAYLCGGVRMHAEQASSRGALGGGGGNRLPDS